MPAKIEPFLGLSYGAPQGEDNWNIWSDENTLTLGQVLHIRVMSATTTAPQPVVNGERWLIPSGATGVWASHIGEVACAVEGTFRYALPRAGMRITVTDTAKHLYYTGSAWADFDDYGTLP